MSAKFLQLQKKLFNYSERPSKVLDWKNAFMARFGYRYSVDLHMVVTGDISLRSLIEMLVELHGNRVSELGAGLEAPIIPQYGVPNSAAPEMRVQGPVLHRCLKPRLAPSIPSSRIEEISLPHSARVHRVHGRPLAALKCLAELVKVLHGAIDAPPSWRVRVG